ncbi:Integrase catalytic domain-containing protein [Citrus sinensis]|uniref:Integrase catalytic domain-containing protein n=1 Tax=Citrus sinensis TaxID=2711 RepID=A0ACB8IK19_CITSI|nr:Integrase catalytic domain-containing protein [Citrus sinensis]
MDALIQIDLDVVLKNKRHLYNEEIWDRMNEKACGQIRSCLTKEVKYLVKDEECVMTLWRSLGKKYLLKSLENRLHAMSQVYDFRMKPGVSMHDHVSRFENLLATLIYGKSVFVFKDVCIALTNLEIQNNDKNSERASSKALLKATRLPLKMAQMKFTHGAIVILQGVRHHNLYYLKECTTDKENVAEAHNDTTKLLHVRLGHAGEKSLQTLMKHGLLKANHDTREILEYVHSDVCGPTKTASIGGSHYFVTFIDDFSRRVWVYTMRAKDEVLEIFVKWKKLVETQTDRKITVLRYDNEGEYTSDPFLQVCQNEGIKRHFTVRHTLQQNGVTDRMNSTLLEKLPSAAIEGKTPMEMWSGKHAQDYNSLRIFGCPAYYHVKDGKLDHRARKAIFVGFKGGVKGFKLWDLEDKKFVCSRDVTFDEASSSQQVENKTTEVLQRVEFDATPYVTVSSTSEKGSTMEVTPRVEEVVSSDVPQNEETIDDVDNDNL